MVMACSVVPHDEEHDFVEQPSRDFFCPVTFDQMWLNIGQTTFNYLFQLPVTWVTRVTSMKLQ